MDVPGRHRLCFRRRRGDNVPERARLPQPSQFIDGCSREGTKPNWPRIAPQVPQTRTRRFFKALVLYGERAGTRTQDPLIKSQMLYRLSYALP